MRLLPSRLPATVFIAAVLILLALPVGHTLRAELRTRVSGNLVFWDQARGFEAIMANSDVFSEISPFWYRVLADGRVVPYTTSSGATYEDPAIVSFLRANGILIIPTVANIIDGLWDGPAVSRIIREPALAAFNISALVQLAVDKGYDGIDLDYEDLPASDRDAFTVFVTELAAALHGRGKLLTVNVYAKTSEPGTWSGPQSQDWRAIGAVADQVRIMAYEYHWSGSGPGPVAPVWWVRDVLTFATTVIPAGKIMHGLPLYGYDWVGQSGTALVWEEAVVLAARYGVPINWEPYSASSWFEYTVRNTRHTVWFEDAGSTDAKLQVGRVAGVGGVSLWRLGGEDPSTWPALRGQFGGGSPPDPTPPSVTIASPLDGAIVTKKQTISVLASDNVAVARVEFFIDGRLVATDATAPYGVSWNTQPAARGPHVITVVAYDTTGNSATSSITVYK